MTSFFEEFCPPYSRSCDLSLGQLLPQRIGSIPACEGTPTSSPVGLFATSRTNLKRVAVYRASFVAKLEHGRTKRPSCTAPGRPSLRSPDTSHTHSGLEGNPSG